MCQMISIFYKRLNLCRRHSRWSWPAWPATLNTRCACAPWTARDGASSPTLSSSEQQVEQQPGLEPALQQFQFRTAGTGIARDGASSPTLSSLEQQVQQQPGLEPALQPFPVQNSRYSSSQGWSQLSNPFQFRTAGTRTARAGASSPILSSSEQQVQQQPGLEPALQPFPVQNSRYSNIQGWRQLSNPFQFRTAGTATARAGASSPTIPVQNSMYSNSQGWSQLSNPFQFRTAGTVAARAGACSPTLSSSEGMVQEEPGLEWA